MKKIFCSLLTLYYPIIVTKVCDFYDGFMKYVVFSKYFFLPPVTFSRFIYFAFKLCYHTYTLFRK